uniref:Protein FAR1-RELATED SEQUENCE n=1 Tax=Manihot esculenta TaxID=3983 RepID=A0A2C9WAA2_MANES
MWGALIKKYELKENAWLREIESLESFFGTFLNAQTPLAEFISRYEQGLAQRRDEERKEVFSCYNLQAFLHAKEPVEEQCRRLYTLTAFKIFQNELLQSYNYLGIKTYEEGTICRYSVRRCGNGVEKHAVTFSAANLNVCCSCQMFEFEGILYRHILIVFNMLDIREFPPCYILHRWTKNAEYGTIRDIESGVSPQELKSLIFWSLRVTACKFVRLGQHLLKNTKSDMRLCEKVE